MNTRRKMFAAALMLALIAGQSSRVFACAACYGQSDSPMAEGMNWGIMALLVVVGVVLSGIAGFFIYIAKKTGKPDHG